MDLLAVHPAAFYASGRVTNIAPTGAAVEGNRGGTRQGNRAGPIRHDAVERGFDRGGPRAPGSADALGELCRTYWYPIYAFVRRRGNSHEAAQDLTQEFFARMLEKRYIDEVGPEKGTFRTFLLVCLKRFLANEWDRDHAQKRGGGSGAPVDRLRGRGGAVSA